MYLAPFFWALVFAVTPLIHSFHTFPTHNHRRSLHHSNLHVARQTLPQGWSSKGCYLDNVGGVRTLQAAREAGPTMTVESCIAFCISGNFIYAGVEYADECYCDNLIGAGATNLGAPSTDCNMPCAGSSSEMCGAGNRLNVYWSGATPPAPPTVVPSVGDWVSLGCYSDNNPGGRTLLSGEGVSGQVTIQSCTTACFNAGFPLAGTEYSAQCFCGSVLSNGGAPISSSHCDMTCAGDASEYCGGPNALNMYNYTGTGLTGGGGGSGGISPVTTGLPSPWTYGGCYVDGANGRILSTQINDNSALTVAGCIATCSGMGFTLAGLQYSVQCFCGNTLVNGAVAAPGSNCNMACSGAATEACGGPDRDSVYTSTGTVTLGSGSGGGTGGISPVTSGLPTPWTYGGCWVDNLHGRIFTTQINDNSALTVQLCISTCAGMNYTLAGMEYGVQCFCGNTLIDGAAKAPDTDCNMACGGAATEACGGPNRDSVYTATGTVVALPVPTTQTTGLPGEWTYHGCFAEPNAARMFPHQIINTNNNSVNGCLSLCSTFGFPAGGMEYMEECYCGDVSDIATGAPAAETDCSMACSGDPLHLCGGALKLSVYTWNGNLQTWHTPAVTGQYKLLIGGVVVPLLATAGINGKVTFLEKSGTSPYANSTGAYELDLSLVDNSALAWRTMHVKSDVFCSAAIVLPDKAARLINVGGWSLDSTYGIRFYTPDGSPGVNGTNDWEENYNEVALQRGRWYPSAVVLANGTVLVVGGENGSNGPSVPSLETLPTPPGGDTTIHLDFLARTDPNNLYPFLLVLPSGNLLIVYYNEARILNPATFAVITVLPNLPGTVDNFLAGRTYPLEGSAVFLPQSAPYTDPITVLVCGGSTNGAGEAIDNCVSIQPEVAGANWVIERMPSKRVMPCIAGLPDGTFLILNGAEQGYAGFGLASNPNLNAILYDPSQPVNSRFSILGNTIVARLYHSEATLLQDGRVLVSGSDPETPGYPEEFRVEVYIPPYLSQGFTQPSFTIAETDWAYGGQYSITVTLHQGSTSTMKVSLVAATSSTHGNTMGSRIIFPAFSCSGNTCTITAPPNSNVIPPAWHQLFILDGPTPSHSTFVRIGGDPAHLGNWPNFPDFTRPGI